MAAPQTEVLITVAGMETARFVLTPGDYVIGRNADCPIRVEADLVSRQHAMLILNYDHALIEDLGSSNGTQVNGQPIAKDGRTRLWPNQKIQVGTATIELRRLKVEVSDLSLAPSAAMVKRALPEEFLREKKYDIGKIVAQGGMGAILDAREATTERTVAMKVMLDTNDADGLARFLNEAKITAQLEHPNIVPVHELSVDENGQPYYTMKMVRGITLKKVLELMAAGESAQSSVRSAQSSGQRAKQDTEHCELRTEHFSLPTLLTIFQKVCDALAFAHSKGVIHRDLKPENLMLGDYGEVLVMDWGLAKIFTQPAGGRARAAGGELSRSAVKLTLPGGAAPTSAESTMDGTIMGTPQFMSPEQARGEVEALDARSDIYSLGAILYQVLSLRVPVTGTDAMEVVGKVGRGEIEPLQGAGAPPPRVSPNSARGRPGSLRIPDSLAAVVRKAMSLDRAARYATVADLQRDIEAYQTGFATSAEMAGKWKRFTLFVKRNKAASIGVAAVIVLTIGFMAKVIAEGRRAERALVSLRRAAPSLAAQAQALVAEQKLDDAVEKLDFALAIEPDNLDYTLRRATYLQAALHLRSAAEAYRSVLRRGPNAAAEASLALCEKLLAAHGDGPLPDSALDELRTALVAQHRDAEAMPLAIRLGKGKEAILAVLLERLGAWQKLPGWRDDRIRVDTRGLVNVSLESMPISDLRPIQGLFVEALNIVRSKVTDLRPLVGMRLKEFSADNTRELRSLEGLEGAPLEAIHISNTGVADLSPLRDSPLKSISMGSTPVSDLSPLRECPLDTILADGAAIQSIEVLRGKHMRIVNLRRCQALTDISLLKDCATLQTLLLPPRAQNIEFLRTMPGIQKLGYEELRPVAEFWAEYDAQQAAGKK